MKNVVIPDTGDVIAGRYRLDGVLGRGGFGIVFRATHLEMNRTVAIKTLLPQAASSPDAVERFRQEAVLAAGLTHPNTITLFDYGQTPEGLLYLVMEHLTGHTLKDRLKRAGRLPLKRVRALMVQTLKSLAEAHAKGIIHRDLKPENIFLCDVPGEQDFVKVLDFGIAKILEAPTSPDADLSAGASFGTPKYMAPEQISGGQLGPWTDLYALGLIAFEAASGRAAYMGRTPLEIIAKQANGPVPELPMYLKGTPVGRVIERCIQKEPSVRYPSASAALEELLEASDWVEPTPPVGAGSLLGDALPTSGWGAPDGGAMDSGRFLAEAVLQEPMGEMEVGATMVQDPLSEASYAHSGRFMSEGVLLDDDDAGEMESESTRLEESPFSASPMDVDPTRVRLREEVAPPRESTVNLDLNELMEVHTGQHALPQATPVPTARPGAAGRAAAAPAPAPAPAPGAPQAAGRAAGRSAGRVAAAAGRPVPQGAAQALQPLPAAPAAEGEDASVLFSVQDAASQIARSAGAPAAPVAQVAAAPMAFRAHTDPRQQPVARRGIDRNMLIAFSVLGMGLIAAMLVVVLYLLKPMLTGATAEEPGPVATAGEGGAGEAGAAKEGAVLDLTSEPAGAEVFLDGKKLGVTPLKIERSRARGVVTITLRKDGFEDTTEEITYDGDRALQMELSAAVAQAEPLEEVKEVKEVKEAAPPPREERKVEEVARKEVAPPPKKETPPAEVARKEPAKAPAKAPAASAASKPPTAKRRTTTPPKSTGGGGKKSPFGKW